MPPASSPSARPTAIVFAGLGTDEHGRRISGDATLITHLLPSLTRVAEVLVIPNIANRDGVLVARTPGAQAKEAAALFTQHWANVGRHGPLHLIGQSGASAAIADFVQRVPVVRERTAAIFLIAPPSPDESAALSAARSALSAQFREANGFDVQVSGDRELVLPHEIWDPSQYLPITSTLRRYGLDHKTVVLYATGDRICPDTAVHYGHRIPGATLVAVPGVSHSFREPTMVTEATKTIIDRIAPPYERSGALLGF